MKKIFIFILAITAVSLTSCLKDKPNTDFSSIGTVLELPWSGLQYFSKDAVTSSSDTVVLKFGVNIASAKTLSTATNYTLAVDYSLMDAVNNQPSAPVTYDQMPTGSYTISKTTGTIPAGKRLDSITVTVYRALLDPSKSYMLPIKLASTSNGILSGNFNAHYYHFIGNDFAGAYTWDYRRWQNGTGPGPGIIPSQSTAGIPPDITGLGQSGTILPISPTEFQMQTGYNGQGVNYDVTFTRTVDPTTHIVSYSNWKVQFLPGDIAKWTAAGITNMVPPSFTIPPPATSNDPKIFELNYVSGGAFGRYIDDTYHK